MSVHILGWISNIFFIYGVWALGKKKVLGFYSNTIANALYLWQSILMHNPSLAWLSIGLIFLNLYGIYQWNKDKQKKILQIPAEEVLKDIADICYDYDGYRTEAGLRELIDDIRDYALKNCKGEK